MKLPSKEDFWFVPLGGSNEIGMNLNLYGHNKEWIVVDLGITFHDRLGIDILTPDPTFLISCKKHLAGIVITHAHEDHVGAVPYLWPYLRCPIYATPFTIQIIRQKIAEKSWANDVQLVEVPLSGEIAIGHFQVEFVTLTHSIPEPNALIIKTPIGKVFHTGDWKIDSNPLVGEPINSNHLEAIGDSNVLAMVCDSTNVFSEGESGSEATVREEIEKLVQDYSEHRIIVACFASNVARLETVMLSAQKYGRKVALIGRSLYKIVEVAQKCGYLKDIKNLVSEEEISGIPDKEIVLITTGSQGEPRSALSRIAEKQHPSLSLKKNDVVFFSSRVIPGNEKSIGHLQNKLVHLGAEVITSQEKNIHVSGHPSRKELQKMYEWIRPKILVPVHGEARHLSEHASFGKSQGIPYTIIPSNGSVINLSPSIAPEIIGHVTEGRWALDGNRLIPFENHSLKDRAGLSINGVVLISLSIGDRKRGELGVLVSERGLIATEAEFEVLENSILNKIHSSASFFVDKNDKTLIPHIKQIVRHICKREFNKNPIVVVHILRK